MGSSVGSPAAYLGNYLTKTNTSFSQAIWPKDLIEKAGYLVLEPSKSTPPTPHPGFQPPNRTFRVIFCLPRKLPKLWFLVGPPFLIESLSHWISSFQSCPSHCFYEPLPQSIGTSFSLKPTLLFLLEILLLQSRLFGESGPLKSSFLAAPGGSRCFYGRIPANAEAAGHQISPGSHVGSLGWHPLSPLPV